jgi:hypothetical protein
VGVPLFLHGSHVASFFGFEIILKKKFIGNSLFGRAGALSTGLLADFS